MELVRVLASAQVDVEDSRGKHPIEHAIAAGDLTIITIIAQATRSRRNFLVQVVKYVDDLTLLEPLQHQYGLKDECGRTTLMLLSARTKLHQLSTKEKDVVNRIMTKEIR